MKTRPNWVSEKLFPFSSQWIEIDGQSMHYVDEGLGPVILFVHGTPEWSFGFRDLITGLQKSYRCIAIDHLGFGLSDKPTHANYTCQAHAARLAKFIELLALKNITLVANDFGGGFAMSYALSYPANVERIILFNTWMRSLVNDAHYATPARWMATAFGKWMYLYLNFPVYVIMPAAFGDKKKLTKEIHIHYKKALPASERMGAYAFTKELIDASPWWQSLWEQTDVVKNKPILIFWGLKDKFVPPSELAKWKERLKEAEVITFDDAGHFVQEEKADEMILAIHRFMRQSQPNAAE